MFWDTVALGGYLALNVLISRVTPGGRDEGHRAAEVDQAVIFLSIPWAVSIHTVTAFLYSGLAARPFWMTRDPGAALPGLGFRRRSGAADSAGLLVRKLTKFDPGKKAIDKLAISSPTPWCSTSSSS